MFVSIEAKGLDEAREALEGIKGGFGKAISRAINRAAVSARKVCTQEIRSVYTVKSGDAKSAMKITRAGGERLSASITATGSPLDITRFKISFKKKGIFVSVKKGSSKLLDKSFVANAGKSVGIYHRVGDPRLPIQREFGPSIPQMMGNPEIVEKMNQATQETLSKRIEHEVWAIKEGYHK